MSRHHKKDKLPPFVPMFTATMDAPAWKAMSRGADVLAVTQRWSIDLRERIARRTLISELVDGNVATADLVAEAELFKRVCRALSWRDK